MTHTTPKGVPATAASQLMPGSRHHPYVPQAVWAGFGQSGNGRKLGALGVAGQRETKHIRQNTRPAPSRRFGPSPEPGAATTG